MNLPPTMRVVECTGAGSPEVMRIGEAPLPRPRPGEALIRVMAAGVNRPDIAQRSGTYPPPADASPILGLEVAGEIVAFGPPRPGETASRLGIGARVCALCNGGGYAEYCAVPVGQCLPWPAGFDAVRAAALPETFFTVWANLFRIGRLAAGETVLVHGGSSGIGTVAIQLARAFGARAYATAGTADKCRLCVELGAEAAINYREEDFAERVKTLTDGRGVDIVLDMVGASYLARNLAVLAEEGRLVVIAVQGGSVADGVDLRRIMSRRLSLTGSTMRPRSTAAKAEFAADLLQNVWPWLEDGTVRPLIHAVLPFEQVAQAHRLMESGTHSGKIVLSLMGDAPG